MSIANCEQCGKVILVSFDKRCKPCAELHLKETRKVKEFVRLHPRASIMDVYHQTGVSLQTIKELI